MELLGFGLLVTAMLTCYNLQLTLTKNLIPAGNPEVMDEIWNSSQNLEFTYLRILKLLYSSDDVVR